MKSHKCSLIVISQISSIRNQQHSLIPSPLSGTSGPAVPSLYDIWYQWPSFWYSTPSYSLSQSVVPIYLMIDSSLQFFQKSSAPRRLPEIPHLLVFPLGSSHFPFLFIKSIFCLHRNPPLPSNWFEENFCLCTQLSCISIIPKPQLLQCAIVWYILKFIIISLQETITMRFVSFSNSESTIK